MKKIAFRGFAAILLAAVACASLVAQATAPAPAGVKQLGSIQKISGSQLSLSADQGSVIAVNIQPVRASSALLLAKPIPRAQLPSSLRTSRSATASSCAANSPTMVSPSTPLPSP